jgi:hypothetical protein
VLSGGPACGRIAVSQALEEEQSGKGDRGVELGEVKGVGDEVGKFCLAVSGGLGVFGAGKQVTDKAGTEAGCVFMPVEEVWLPWSAV